MGFTPTLLIGDGRGGPEPLAVYRERGGFAALASCLDGKSPADVLATIDAAELRGRGGAGFPTARKWALARASLPGPRVVVGNAGEHEPGSAKDKTLLERHPLTVLEGIAIAAWVTGAETAYVYVMSDMTAAVAAVRGAIAEATAAGLLGENILGRGFNLQVEIAEAPPTYVAGEETAALEVIEGRPPLPRQKPPYPGERGVRGLPTTVNNVETLAHVPGIVLERPGAGKSRLYTLDDRVHRPGIYELPLGATFRDLIYGCGGGPKSGRAIQAIVPALSAGVIPGSALELAMTDEALAPLGATPGCGGVSFVEEGEELVDRLVEISTFFKESQCGQCPPCRLETATLAAVMVQVRDGKAGDYAAQINKVTTFARKKGKCGLIEMAATPMLTALRHFPNELARRAGGGAASPAAPAVPKKEPV